jgi:hypothetical protein
MIAPPEPVPPGAGASGQYQPPGLSAGRTSRIMNIAVLGGNLGGLNKGIPFSLADGPNVP